MSTLNINDFFDSVLLMFKKEATYLKNVSIINLNTFLTDLRTIKKKYFYQIYNQQIIIILH